MVLAGGGSDDPELSALKFDDRIVPVNVVLRDGGSSPRFPSVPGSVAFVDVGCLTPTGYPRRSVSHAVVFLRSGTPTVETATYKAVPVKSIESSLQ